MVPASVGVAPCLNTGHSFFVQLTACCDISGGVVCWFQGTECWSFIAFSCSVGCTNLSCSESNEPNLKMQQVTQTGHSSWPGWTHPEDLVTETEEDFVKQAWSSLSRSQPCVQGSQFLHPHWCLPLCKTHTYTTMWRKGKNGYCNKRVCATRLFYATTATNSEHVPSRL